MTIATLQNDGTYKEITSDEVLEKGEIISFSTIEATTKIRYNLTFIRYNNNEYMIVQYTKNKKIKDFKRLIL